MMINWAQEQEEKKIENKEFITQRVTLKEVCSELAAE